MYDTYVSTQGWIDVWQKCFDVDDADNIIIDGIPLSGLYELIFKEIPDDLFYTKDDMNKYKSMLLAKNEHKHKHYL